MCNSLCAARKPQCVCCWVQESLHLCTARKSNDIYLFYKFPIFLRVFNFSHTTLTIYFPLVIKKLKQKKKRKMCKVIGKLTIYFGVRLSIYVRAYENNLYILESCRGRKRKGKRTKAPI